MPFTPQEKADLLQRLEWPVDTLDKTRVYYNSQLDDRVTYLNSIETAVVKIRYFLGRCDAIDSQLETSINRLKASTIGRGDISLNDREIDQLRSERDSIIEELSKFAGIPTPSDLGWRF